MSPIALPVAELKPALIGLGKVISRRVTLPVLGHVRIERTPDGWVTLTGTDLDQFATVRLEQPTQGEPISLLVPYEELLKVTKRCTNTDEITVTPSKKSTAPLVNLRYPIGTQFAENNVASIPADEFPPIPKLEGEACPLPNAVRQSIHEAFDCASDDETRLILNGAYLDVSDQKCQHVVGTNGRHLFSSNSFNLPLKESILIPAHKFLDWKQFNNDGEWQLRIGTSEEKDVAPSLQISSRRWQFVIRQIDGNYPNWRQVVPTPSQSGSSVEFDPDTLDLVVQTIARMPCHDNVNFTIGLQIKGKAVSLLGKSQGTDDWIVVGGDAKATGKDLTIFLNRHYLTKALNFGLNRIDLIDPMSPMRFSHEGRQMIVMPVRADVGNPPPAAQAQSEEPNGEGAAETVNSEQPAASADVALGERNPMNESPATSGNGTNGNSANGAHATSPVKPALETAVEQVETVKASIKSAVSGLNELLDTLKQVQRERKTTDKEVQSVRSTLERLQSVKL